MGGEPEDPIQRCFDASYRRLVGQLYGVCGDLSEAEDAVAEAFARAVSRRRTFERLDNPEAWLRTVAHLPEYWQPAGLTPEIGRTEGWTFGAL